MQKTTRRSRMVRTRTNKRLMLTQRDLEIFRQLARYTYLRSNFLHTFVGGASETRFKERLGDLYHQGFIDRPAKQWELANCRYVPTICELGAGGRRALLEHGLTGCEPVTFLASGAHRQFSHALMICDILASIELATRGRDIRFISWHEILAKAPASTRSDNRPFALSVNGDRASAPLIVIPDGLFGIEYRQGGTRTFRFFALEVDRATMPVKRRDPYQSSFQRKLNAYQHLVAHGIHSQRWKIPNLLVLTVTVSEVQMAGMLVAARCATHAHGNFAFRVSEQHGWPSKSIAPDPELLWGRWQRAALRPLCIADETSQ